MNKRRIQHITSSLIFVSVLFIIDRILKYWALYGLYHTKINIFKGIFSFELFKNYFIAFSIPVSSFVSIPVSLLMIVALTVLLVQRAKVYWSLVEVGLLLMVTGALSNIYDRLQYGFVIDYLNLSVWPVFNLADVMVSIGVILIICRVWRQK